MDFSLFTILWEAIEAGDSGKGNERVGGRERERERGE